MRKFITIFMMLICSQASAGEGHRWAKLGYESKAIIIAMYENGLSVGCVNGVSLSTEELFSDSEMQNQQAVKLIFKCPNKVANTSPKMQKVVDIVKQAYTSPGAASIPMGILIPAALKAVDSGQNEIDDAELKKWISVSSKL